MKFDFEKYIVSTSRVAFSIIKMGYYTALLNHQCFFTKRLVMLILIEKARL